MIADYKENGRDRNKPFVVFYTSNYQKAVDAVAAQLRQQGCTMTLITVCPSAHSLEDLKRLAAGELKDTEPPQYFIFDRDEVFREAAKRKRKQ